MTGGEITQESVRRVLGLVENERYLEFMDILASRQHGEVFAFVERLLDEGYDLVEFYHGLVDVLRSLLRLSLGGDPPELDGEIRRAFVARLEPFQPGDIMRMLSLASELESSGSLRRSANPQILLEMLLLRLSYVDRTVTLEELLTSLGVASPPADPPSGAPDGGDARSSGSSEPDLAGESVAQEPTSPARRNAENASDLEVSPEADEGSETGEGGASASVLASATEAWARLMDEGKGILPGMRLFLRAAVVRLGEDGALVVELPAGPGLERLREQTALRTIQNALEVLMGERPEIVVRAMSEASSEKLERITPETVRSDRLRELIQREPLLQHAVEELDLELLD